MSASHALLWGKGKIKDIVIHCAATPNGRDDSMADVHRWHLERGWDGVGYHYGIRIDGTVERGRPEYWQGAHVAGRNHGTIGILLFGTDQFSDEQWDSLEWLVHDLTARFPEADVSGHREHDPGKYCPGFDVKPWWEIVKKKIAKDQERP